MMGFDLKKMAGDMAGKVVADKLNLNELIDESFLSKFTQVDSVKEFLDRADFDAKSITDLKNVDEGKLNSYVKKISNFGSWKDLLAKAVAEKK